MQLRSFEKYPP